ncbi:anti-sigma factor [Alkalihalobacillus trypoxylicola]|uniref:Anti-sigma-W factor RsiW n=1 Tax=Alkalihalobacillus trypoxylicola TaxID=519424 RepID=A0A161QGY7_9BACI|nr:anti-sigma factor [Alkalihalobacillus trypoxylicola]KYG28250.1 hypothetical protein AZF04_10150 [Alkalihalobacillus trypoxylicola]
MSNSCERLMDYYNEHLKESERKQFEEHLENCSNCQEELAEIHSLMDDLGFDVEPIEPPTEMKARVLDEVFKHEPPQKNNTIMAADPGTINKENSQSDTTEREVTPLEKASIPSSRKTKWLIPTMAAALILSLVGNVYSYNQLANIGEEPPAVPETFVSVDSLERMVNLQPSEELNFQATALLVNKENERELVVQAENLAPTNEAEVYQVWLLKDGEPFRAGTFTPNSDGSGASTFTIEDPSIPFDTIAITIEPNPTSETPLGDIILSEVIY